VCPAAGCRGEAPSREVAKGCGFRTRVPTIAPAALPAAAPALQVGSNGALHLVVQHIHVLYALLLVHNMRPSIPPGTNPRAEDACCTACCCACERGTHKTVIITHIRVKRLDAAQQRARETRREKEREGTASRVSCCEFASASCVRVQGLPRQRPGRACQKSTRTSGGGLVTCIFRVVYGGS